MQNVTRWAPRWETVLSATLIALAFPPWDLSFLVWGALVPWLFGVERSPSYATAAIQGLWLSFGVGILAANWVAYAIVEFMAVAWPVGVFGLIVFAATSAQPHLVLFALLFRWLTRNGPLPIWWGPPVVLVAALGYVGLEALVPRLFDVGLGYALHSAANLRQVADLGGVDLLTFGVVVVNGLVWQIVEQWSGGAQSRTAIWVRAGWVVLLCSTAAGYGLLRNREVAMSIAQPERVVRASLAQGNVANEVRLAWARGDDRAAERQLSTYMLMTEQFMKRDPKPDLVVWPEATFPGVFRKPSSKLQQGRAVKFDRQVLRLNTPILFGAYDVVERDDGPPTLFNALFAITPSTGRRRGQGTVRSYRKSVLLPFAETFPGASDDGLLHRLLPSVGFFGAGPGPVVFEIRADGQSLPLSPIICSESLNAQYVIDGVRLGSQLIVNVGSDGWFGPHGEPQFHLAIARMRSVETRRSQIRAANTGISALILPNGEIAQRSDWGVEQALHLEVPIVAPADTLMVAWGDVFGRAAAVAAVALVVLQWLARRASAAPRDRERTDSGSIETGTTGK